MRVISHNFPFHVHILCIRYGTVLANTAVLSMRVRIVCLPVRSAPGKCYYNTIIQWWMCACCFTELCKKYLTKWKFGHHTDTLGYLCAKFCFFRSIHCWASPWRKIAYSITHPAYLIPRELKRLRFETTGRFHSYLRIVFEHQTKILFFLQIKMWCHQIQQFTGQQFRLSTQTNDNQNYMKLRYINILGLFEATKMYKLF